MTGEKIKCICYSRSAGFRRELLTQEEIDNELDFIDTEEDFKQNGRELFDAVMRVI